jgi:hypothetical protein
VSTVDGPIDSMSQQEAWTILSSAMLSGAVDAGIRREVENELLASPRYTGLFAYRTKGWLTFVAGVLSCVAVWWVCGWKFGIFALPMDWVFWRIARWRDLSGVRWVLTQDRIAFHGLLEKDSIRPRVNRGKSSLPFTQEELALLIRQSRPR